METIYFIRTRGFGIFEGMKQTILLLFFSCALFGQTTMNTETVGCGGVVYNTVSPTFKGFVFCESKPLVDIKIVFLFSKSKTTIKTKKDGSFSIERISMISNNDFPKILIENPKYEKYEIKLDEMSIEDDEPFKIYLTKIK